MSPGRLLLDTHIVLWLKAGLPRLRAATRELIDECRSNGGTILFSAVSAWEIAQLVDAKRIELDMPPPSWIESFVHRPGIAVVPLTISAAARAYDLGGFESRDPADRLLIATAIELGCPLVTYDARMTDFAAAHGRECGFSALP